MVVPAGMFQESSSSCHLSSDKLYPSRLTADVPALYNSTKSTPEQTESGAESFEETSKRLHIVANIIVERESQKGIIIGHKGQQLKKIGTAARQRIETLLGQSVYLLLQVRVLKQWSRHEHYLQAFGMK